MSWSHKVSSIQPRSANVVSGQDRVPQLDVLRGVAILLVLMFHPPVRYSSSSEAPWIAFAFFHIGWTGVDLSCPQRFSGRRCSWPRRTIAVSSMSVVS